MLTACSVTPSPGKLRQSPGRVGKKKCLRKSRVHHGDHGPANIYSSRSTVFVGMCFREKLTAGYFMRGRVIQRNVAEGFLQLTCCWGCQPPAPVPHRDTCSRGGRTCGKGWMSGVSQFPQPSWLLALVPAWCGASREPCRKET